MSKSKDPSADLFQMMDRAGLSTANMYDTKRPMSKIVHDIRASLVQQLTDYIQSRESITTGDINGRTKPKID